jgi:hypothetical protein
LVEGTDDLPMRLARCGVAVGMEVFDAVPLPPDIDVADDLSVPHLRLKLDAFSAVGAVHAASRFDIADDRSARPG